MVQLFACASGLRWDYACCVVEFHLHASHKRHDGVVQHRRGLRMDDACCIRGLLSPRTFSPRCDRRFRGGGRRCLAASDCHDWAAVVRLIRALALAAAHLLGLVVVAGNHQLLCALALCFAAARERRSSEHRAGAGSGCRKNRTAPDLRESPSSPSCCCRFVRNRVDEELAAKPTIRSGLSVDKPGLYLDKQSIRNRGFRTTMMIISWFLLIGEGRHHLYDFWLLISEK